MDVINDRSRAPRDLGSLAPQSPRPAAALPPVGLPRRAGRPGRFLVALTGLIAAAGLLAACGTATMAGSAAKSSGKSSKVELSLRLIDGKGSLPKHWTLHCQPTGGNAPDATTSCRALLHMKNPFAPVSKTRMCPMILAGSQQIVVTGTWFGHKVHRVVLDGECDLGLFESLHKTFN